MFRLIFTVLFLLSPIFLFSQTQIGSDIDGEAANDVFGWSVSLSADGSILAIGAHSNDGNGSDSGHVRVYENQSGAWIQIGSDIDGEAAGDRSGWSVSLSNDGSVLVVGAPFNDGNGSDSGHVRVYENQSGAWTQIGSDIDGEASYDGLGRSVSISGNGNIIAIGASGNDGNGSNSGNVRVYENQSGNWIQIGSDIDGEAVSDGSGNSISLSADGNIVAIGARSNDGNGSNSGHVRVYENQSGNWIQIGSDIDGEVANDNSGISVSLNAEGNIVAIGAHLNDDVGNNSGHVRVYRLESGIWTQIGSDINGSAESESGLAVCLNTDGGILAVGAPSNDAGFIDSGRVQVYRNQSGNTYSYIGEEIRGEAFDDSSGWSVSLSADGSIVAIGARLNDGNGIDSGHVRVFDLSAVLSNDEFTQTQIGLFPNPAEDNFTVQLNDGAQLQSIRVYNTLGKFVSEEIGPVVNTSNFSNGIYFIRIETDRGSTTKKLIIE